MPSVKTGMKTKKKSKHGRKQGFIWCPNNKEAKTKYNWLVPCWSRLSGSVQETEQRGSENPPDHTPTTRERERVTVRTRMREEKKRWRDCVRKIKNIKMYQVWRALLPMVFLGPDHKFYSATTKGQGPGLGTHAFMTGSRCYY